jgi:hypothetical protein
MNNEQTEQHGIQYPTEPFINTYEMIIRKWGQEINKEEGEVQSTWNRLNPIVLWLFVDDLYWYTGRLMRATPFEESKYSEMDTDSLLERVQNNENTRRDLQLVMYESYKWLVENESDEEYNIRVTDTSKSRRRDYGFVSGIRLVPVSWKPKLVWVSDEIDRVNNNPFDVLWYLGTSQVRQFGSMKKFILFLYRLFPIVIVISFFYWLYTMSDR